MIKAFWAGLGARARAGLVAGVLGISLFTGGAGWFLLRTEWQVLFADLTPADAAAMLAELERQKIPYRLGGDDGGGATAILVDERDVYRTRLKLMGKDIPLHGGVGFELFNGSDFGMTEFAQRINYQRALQGELARTILSISELRDARVLLALPEQGLFKQGTAKAKASVTLTAKPGVVLRAEQVAGIQRLVAAAVPGIAAQDVTIVDQSGVALTRVAGEAEPEGGGRLDFKKDMENYLSRKASAVLERALGAGQALVSVDVVLDMDRVQTTTEDVVGAPAAAGQPPTGVLVRERESVRDGAAPLDAKGSPASGSSQREVEYAVGRRVEQVINVPGSVRRVQAVAVVKAPLDARQLERIRAMVAASVGASPERGDAVVVQPLEAIRPPAEAAVAQPASEASGRSVPPDLAAEDRPGAQASFPLADVRGRVALGAAVLAVVAAAALLRRRARSAVRDERQAALAQVEAWMSGREVGPAEGDA